MEIRILDNQVFHRYVLSFEINDNRRKTNRIPEGIIPIIKAFHFTEGYTTGSFKSWQREKNAYTTY